MPSTVAKQTSATAGESLAGVRCHTVKASLREQEGASRLREVAADAMRKVTSQKAAATDIGIHEGRLSHKLQDGSLTLAQLEELGPMYAAELGRALLQTYGVDLETSVQRIRRVLRAMRAACDEIDHAAESFEK